jgi:ABC-type transport system involved in multi-copper enzyme maturation permease subunit
MKFKIELLNYYMFLGWILIIAALIGILYFITSPEGQETVLGFAFASLLCGAIMLYLGYTNKTVFKKKKK